MNEHEVASNILEKSGHSNNSHSFTLNMDKDKLTSNLVNSCNPLSPVKNSLDFNSEKNEDVPQKSGPECPSASSIDSNSEMNEDDLQKCDPASPSASSIDSNSEMVNDVRPKSDSAAPTASSLDSNFEMNEDVLQKSDPAYPSVSILDSNSVMNGDVLQKFDSEGPLASSLDSNSEMNEDVLQKSDSACPSAFSLDSNSEMNENILQEPDTADPSASSLDFNFEMNEDKTSNDLQKSCPVSPASSLDSTSDISEVETESSVPKKNLTLPYFHLPNPVLDEFLIETEKNLGTPEINTRASRFPLRTFEPKDKGDIDFVIDSDASKSCNENIRNKVTCSDYQRMLSSIDKLNDSKSPGIKRLVLKDYLKKKIEEKKILAFERSKELAKLDDEIEVENEEETAFVSESSEEEDLEEPTVLFDKEETKTDEFNNFSVSSPELPDYSNAVDDCSDDNNNDDDDEEGFGVPKARKVHVLEDDSSDESCLDFDGKSHGDNPFADTTELKCQGLPKSTNCSDYSESCSPKKLNDVDHLPKSFNSSDEDNSEISSPKKLSNGVDDFSQEVVDSGMEICSSIPSYQPGGGFNYEKDEDSKESDSLEWMQIPNKYPISMNSRISLLNNPVLEETETDSPTFGLSLDDPPVSQPENGPDLFSTQDIANVCSGVFKESTPQETKFQKESDKIYELDEESQDKIKDFFDNEAELSGDDDGADDDDEDGEFDEAHNDLVDDHEIPAEELRDEIADLHMKRIRDDDDELLKELKEKFLDDGELNNDGSGRTRRFAWLNNDSDAICKVGKDSSSDSDSDDALGDTWSSISKEKAKWRQEKADDESTHEISSSFKKPHLKLNIIGKPEFAKSGKKSLKNLSYKRPRGSFLDLDDSEASSVLKKLKASEDTHDGSRTTRHFLFRNDFSSDMATSSKGPFNDKSTIDAEEAGCSIAASIFM